MTLLVAKMLAGFAELNIPAEAAHLYVEKAVANTFANPEGALTGPLIRKDVTTVQANLDALKNNSYHGIYQAFLKTYWPDYPKK